MKALRQKPEQNWYNDLVIEIRLANGDLSAIDDAIQYYQNDMDCLVHSGKTSEWLHKLISSKNYRKAAALIGTVNHLLDEQIAGRRTNRRFFGQNPDFVSYKKGNSSATKRHKRHKREKDGNEPDEASKIDSGSPPFCSRCAFCAFLWLCLSSY
jgi:hypothetical protein